MEEEEKNTRIHTVISNDENNQIQFIIFLKGSILIRYPCEFKNKTNIFKQTKQFWVRKTFPNSPKSENEMLYSHWLTQL